MFRSTFLVIILAIFGFGIIFGLIAGVVGSMVEKQQSVETVESSSEADRVQEEATEEEETQKTPQEIAAIKTYVEAGVMIVFLAILLWGMYSGSKDGTDIFQMADVNLLFTAPMKPQSVLMFRLSFQMVATVFASIYLVFQIPNLVVNMGLGASQLVDKHVISLKIHCLCALSTYKIHLSTLYNPINCTFATEKGFKNFK